MCECLHIYQSAISHWTLPTLCMVTAAEWLVLTPFFQVEPASGLSLTYGQHFRDGLSLSHADCITEIGLGAQINCLSQVNSTWALEMCKSTAMSATFSLWYLIMKRIFPRLWEALEEAHILSCFMSLVLLWSPVPMDDCMKSVVL